MDDDTLSELRRFRDEQLRADLWQYQRAAGTRADALDLVDEVLPLAPEVQLVEPRAGAITYAAAMEALRIEARALLNSGRSQEARMLADAMSVVHRVVGRVGMGGGRVMGSPLPTTNAGRSDLVSHPTTK